MRSLLPLALIAAAAAAAASCGRSDSKDSNELNLTGTWQSKECTPDGSGALMMTAVFTTTTLDYLQAFYDDTTCANASKSMSLRIVGTFVSGANAASQTATSGATSIDITTTAIKMAIHNQARVNELQASGFCGVKPVKDVEFAVSRSQCAASENIPLETGSVYYQIFKATDADLYIGDDTESLDGSTKDKRPVALRTGAMARI